MLNESTYIVGTPPYRLHCTSRVLGGLVWNPVALYATQQPHPSFARFASHASQEQRKRVHGRASPFPVNLIADQGRESVFLHHESYSHIVACCQASIEMAFCAKLFAWCGCGGKSNYCCNIMGYTHNFSSSGRSKDSLYEPVLADSEREAVAELLGTCDLHHPRQQ